jgi:hypothetical protein
MDMDFEVMQASITDFPRMVASDDDQQIGYFGDEHLWDERKDRNKTMFAVSQNRATQLQVFAILVMNKMREEGAI